MRPGAPEAAVVRLRPAQFGSRVGALVVDLLVCGIPAAVVAWLWYRGQRVEPKPPPDGDSVGLAEVVETSFDSLISFLTIVGAVVLGTFVAFAVYSIYAVILHATIGQTLGKKAVQIRVVKTDGSPCGWPAALKRAVIFPLGGSLLAFLLGLFQLGIGVPLQLVLSLINGVWPLFNDRRQSLGDILAGTRVVDELKV